MKKRLLALMAKKNERKAVIMGQAEKTSSVEELRSLNAELDILNEEIRSFQEMIDGLETDPQNDDGVAERTQIVNGEIPEIVGAAANTEKRKGVNSEIEKRVETVAAELRSGKEVSITHDVQEYLEKRSVSTSSVVLENKYKRKIADNFNEVAQTIDLVDSFTLDGGNSYSVAFQITDGEAESTAEGATYKNSEGTFGSILTGRAKITNSAIVNEEVVDLPNADYLSRIVNSVRKSIRKKVSHQIISGTGGENQLRGVSNMPTNVIPESYKVELVAIDRAALRKIVFSYGGDEDMEAPATLFLSKKDLEAFASIEADDGRPYYSITYNGTSGSIQESGNGLKVPYTINSACKALVADTTASGDKTMFYGNPMAYEMPMFSPLTIKRSDERYIDQGKIGFFGKIIAGGVLNSYKSFIPVVKK